MSWAALPIVERTCAFRLSITGTLTLWVTGWTMDPGTKEIRRSFAFKDYYRGMAFVNAVAWIGRIHPGFFLWENGFVPAIDVHDSPDLRGSWFGKWIGAVRPALEWQSERIESGETGATPQL